MSEKNINFQKLYLEKKYSEIISEIENLDEKQRSSGLLNLLGACKLLRRDANDLISANSHFKAAYLKEKTTKIGLEALINFINSIAEIFDQKIEVIEDDQTSSFIDEAILYFDDADKYFGFNEKLILSIVRIYKRQNNLEKILFYLKKLIDNKCLGSKVLSSYIYRNCFIETWKQKDFFSFSKILNSNLPVYPKENLIPLNTKKNKKIKLAFLSSDINNYHSITYFLKTVLLNYDKNKFEISLILNSEEDDYTSKEFKSLCDGSINIKDQNDIDSINKIRQNNYDIIVDLMGVSSSNRLVLFKNRIAPIQATWLGYCNTTGVDQMDYIFADKNLIMDDEVNLYSEKIIYLSGIWNTHSGLEIERVKKVPPLFKNNYLTFGSFNNFAKINNNVVRVWSEILKSIKNSKLILKSSIPLQTINIKNEFKKYGVLDSVIFSGSKPFKEHLNLYNSIDICLDTFPYNGVTTSFEALWMGVPVLTMRGYNFNSRCGESINKNLNQTSMIADNENDYISKAKEFLDKEKLVNTRNIVFDNLLESPLFDGKKFSKEFLGSLEAIYNK